MNIIFLDEDVKKFINNLEKNTKVKTLRTLDLLEKFTYRLTMPHSKKIKNNLFELRILGHEQIRLFYTFVKPNIIVLCGFKKKSQKIPLQQLEKISQKLSMVDKV